MVSARSDRKTVPGWRGAFAQAKRALPVSLSLHVALLYTVARAPWAVAPIEQLSAPTPVMWLREWPRTTLEPPAEPEPDALEPPAQTAVPVAPAEQTPAIQEIDERPLPEAPAERAREEQPPPVGVEREPQDSVPPADGPRGFVAPGVDWETQRRRAAASVVEQRARDGAYRTFSLDDLPAGDAEGEQPAPTPLAEVMVDHCVIAEGKLQRFAAMMLGRCVRAPRGDLFADAKPEYLKKQPLCVDTREGDDLVADVDPASKFSTVKCRLVDADEE